MADKENLERLADVRWVMDDERGRRYVRGLLAEFGIFRSVMEQRHGVRPEENTAFNAGLQYAAQHVQREAALAHPVAMQLMNNEAYTRKLLEDAKSKQQRRPSTEETGE